MTSSRSQVGHAADPLRIPPADQECVAAATRERYRPPRFALGVQPPDDVARPDHDVGAHPQRQVAQAQLAGLQQRQVNARGCGRVEDVVEPRAPPHECLDALGERHVVVRVGEHRELRADGVERILAEESES